MNNEKKGDWSWKEFILFMLVVAVTVLPIRIFIAQPFIVSGESMDPTFQSGQYLIVDQISYSFKEPERGDVVIFRLPADTNRFLIKRLIGLPGETVKIESNNIYIKQNNEDESQFVLLDEEHVKYKKPTNLISELSEDEFFLLGDNRANSLDSRLFGSINRKFIVGKALVRLFPFKKIEWLPGKISN